MLERLSDPRFATISQPSIHALDLVRRGEVEVAGYDLTLNEGEIIGSGASTEIPGRRDS